MHFKSQAFALFVEIYEGNRTCVLDRSATKLGVPEYDVVVIQHDLQSQEIGITSLRDRCVRNDK